MKFVIVGYGRVGMRTVSILASEGHEIVVVEHDPETADAARQSDVDVVEGDGEDERVLERAGLDDADALGALSGDLNVNFAACMIAKDHGCRTVMRIDEDYRQEIYETYVSDVDEVIYPERMGAAGAKMALLGGDLNVFADLTANLTAAAIRVPENSPVIGKRVVEIDLPGNARIYAHGSATEPMTLPMPRDEIAAGDRLALIAKQDTLDAVRSALRG